jgi:chromosome segregation ATPase
MAGEVERLSGKLGLDTTDFKTAIAAANRELRVLESGFKASAATLTDWTKDATGLENRVKSLNSQMDVQKLKVAALAAEHKRLVAEHGKGSRAAQDIEIKLNKETETLHKMERELDQTEVSLREMGDESKDTAKDVDKLEKEQEQATSAGQKFRKMMDATAATAKGLGRVLKTLLKGFITIGAAVAAAAIGLVAFTVGPA